MPTFAALEAAGGEPIELVTFTQGTSQWRYCSSESSVTVGGVQYDPAVMRVGSHPDSQESTAAALVIRLGYATPVIAAAFQGVLPASRTVVRVLRHQVGASGGDDPAITLVGEVSSVAFKADAVEVSVALIPALLRRQMPRVILQRTCNNSLYDQVCGLNKENFATAATVGSVNADGTLTVAAAAGQPNGYYSTGLIKLVSTGVLTWIFQHTGTTLVPFGPLPPGITAGSAIKIYAGCDKSRATCIARFNNLPRFMGFPDIPNRDPFGVGIF